MICAGSLDVKAAFPGCSHPHESCVRENVTARCQTRRGVGQCVGRGDHEVGKDALGGHDCAPSRCFDLLEVL